MAINEPAQRLLDHLRSRGASFAQEMRAACDLSDADCREALGELVAEGLITSDGFAGLRAIAGSSSERRFSVDAAGRWSAVVRLMPDTTTERDASRDEAVNALAWTLLSRYGVVFRRLLAREVSGVTWRELVRVYRTLEARGDIRGGRFVCGMSGEQYALPDAVERLREVRRSGPDETFVTISGADPLNLTGIVTLGDRIRAAAGNRIVYRNGVPVMAMEGDMLRTLAHAGCLGAGGRRGNGRRPARAGVARVRRKDSGLERASARVMAESVRLAQQIPRRWRRGIALDPRYQEAKGQTTLWTRARKLLWSWWPWFVVSVATAYDNRWGWAFRRARWRSSVTLSPRPKTRRDTASSTSSRWTPMNSSPPSPVRLVCRSSPAIAIDVLNNGDEFYPGDARGDRAALRRRSPSRPTSTGPARSAAASRTRSRQRLGKAFR